MKYNFLGYREWPPRSGELTDLQSADVFRASQSSLLSRETCEGCVCWREFGTCTQVQVEDLEKDKLIKAGGGYENVPECVVFRNCCPVLFFDFIGITLSTLSISDC